MLLIFKFEAGDEAVGEITFSDEFLHVAQRAISQVMRNRTIPPLACESLDGVSKFSTVEVKGITKFNVEFVFDEAIIGGPDEREPFSWVDKETGEPCPKHGNLLCTLANDPRYRDHRHVAAHMWKK